MQKVASAERQAGPALSLGFVAGLLSTLDEPILVVERTGKILLANPQAEQCLGARGFPLGAKLDFFNDVLHLNPKEIFGQLESGEHEVDLPVQGTGEKARAHIHWLPDPDWLVVHLEAGPASAPAEQAESQQPTLQELLQEREITYRNLLAAYLRLQEVNRQKTVFLASAAHELKTPLAVMKGYYDLLLSGSLGKLTEKQHDILQESKESCERLVRLVSMFLNYSALESGKLVLHLRENDMRDCLMEVVSRWHDAFHRKQVKLEMRMDGPLPLFNFDYQKVQQCVGNFLDNALKHTPAGGVVTLTAKPHFWERRVASVAAGSDRRRAARNHPNSVVVAVTDTGPGIAAEYHQEIFEDFVRVDRSSSGMGLGLAITKRLVQAHRGKIWVESEPGRGCTFTLLLPTDSE